MPNHYEYATMSYQVYSGVDPEENSTQTSVPPGGYPPAGWETLHSQYENNQWGFAAALYVNHQKKEAVIAFRGTAVKINWLTNAALVLFGEQLPLTLGFARDFINECKHIIPPEFNLSYTGHSLGGLLAEMSACHHKIKAVTFDSTGCKERLNENEIAWAKQAIIGYVTAPNPVNTLHSRVGKTIRIKIPHAKQLSWNYVARCTIGTVTRGLGVAAAVSSPVGTMAFAAAATSVVSKKAAHHLKEGSVGKTVAKTVSIASSGIAGASSVYSLGKTAGNGLLGLFNTFRQPSLAVASFREMRNAAAAPFPDGIQTSIRAPMGIRSTHGISHVLTSNPTISQTESIHKATLAFGNIEWLLRQHSMTNILNCFNPSTGTLNEGIGILMQTWPTIKGGWANAANDFLGSFSRSMMPFHPGNEGLHTLFGSGENGVIESRIQEMPGYKELAPLPGNFQAQYNPS